MEFNEELKKQAKEIFSLYAKHSPSGYAITEEDFIWTLAEYDSRQTKVSRVELPVKPEIADIPEQFSKEFINFLLVNALRCLTEEQRHTLTLALVQRDTRLMDALKQFSV